MAWFSFTLAFVFFFASHSIPVRPPVKSWFIARLGQGGFTMCYSVLSLLVLAWLIHAAHNAPFVALWAWSPTLNLVPLVVMLPVCLIVTMSLGRPNPFSFGGSRNAQFDPTRPGLVRFTRHPLLVALALWAGSHLVPNGDVAHFVLFGTFATFALVGGRIIDRKKRREMGAATWAHLRSDVTKTPLFAKPNLIAILPRFMLGLILYAVLILAHPVLFGVTPLP